MREDRSMRGTSSERAYNEIRRQIVSLELAPGSRLFEESLASSVGVSRTPLREALRQLTSERLLERQSGGGIMVPELDAREITELYKCRAALEALMAEEAVARITDADIEKLDGIVARNRALVDFPDDAMQYGKALHAEIAVIADNTWANQLHDQVANSMSRYRHFTNHSAQRRAIALEQHQEIVDALRERNTSLVSEIARRHVHEACEEVLRAMHSAPAQHEA